MGIRPQRRTQASRSKATREAILEASIQLLYEHGYGATTTQLVAERAGISRGAMLHQFPVKADLMTFIVVSVYEEERATYAELLAGIDDPEARSLAYIDAVWHVLSRPSGLAVLEILQGSRSDPILREKLAPIQNQIEDDALLALEIEIGGKSNLAGMRLVVWAARGLSIAKVLAEDPETIEESVALLKDMIASRHKSARKTLVQTA